MPNHEHSNAAAADTDRVGIPRRDWTIDAVVGRDESHGLYKYLIHWDPSKHPTSEVQIDFNPGHRKVLVDGRPWQVESLVTSPPIDGVPQTRIRWTDTIHSVWELPSAFEVMAEYDRRYPKPQRFLDFGRQGLSILDVEDPETPSDEHLQGTIEDYHFVPQAGLCYTLALFHRAEADLRNVGLIVDSAIQFMNMPRRQNLIFSIEFTAAQTSYNATRPLLFRILFVQVVGHAHARQCSHCKARGGPFAKCVSLRAEFAGACTNCAFAGIGTSCEYHNKNEWILQLRPAGVDADEVDNIAAASVAGLTRNSAAALPRDAADRRAPSMAPSSTYSSSSRPASSSMQPPPGDPTPPINLRESQAAPSKSRKRRREEIDHEETGVQSPARRQRQQSVPAANYPSPQSQPATPPPSEDIYKMYHLQCRKAGIKCINPVTGYILPTNLSHYKNYTVYQDEVVEKGSLTSKQVQYIISRSPCGLTMILDEGWKAAQVIPGVEAYSTKWSYFSDVWYDLLGVAVKRFCGFRKNEVIDLCDD